MASFAPGSIIKTPGEHKPAGAGISLYPGPQTRTHYTLFDGDDEYRVLVEQASDGIHTYAPDGRLLDVNARLCQLLGYTREELLKLNVADLVLAEDLADHPIRFGELLAGETLLKERRLVRKDGTVFFAEISGRAIRENVILGIVRDVSARKLVEERLRQSEERLRNILEASHDGILVEDNERIVFVNRSYLDLFGFDGPHELIGRSVAGIVADDDVDRVLAYGRCRLVGSDAPSKYEFKGRKRDGTEFHVEASVSVSVSSGSTLVTSFIRDIGERKRFETRLAAQKEALEMVLRGAPLREILLYITQAVEAQSDGQAVASILLLDHEGRLRNAASPSLPGNYLDAIDGLKADVNVGTCCSAAASGKVVVTPDIESDPAWEGLAELPIALGLVAAWSTPIIARDGRVLGTFGTYFRERRGPTEMEKQTVEILAHTAALTIEQKESEEKLQSSRRELVLIADAIPILVSFVGSDQRYRFANRAYTEWFKVSRDQVVGQHMSKVLGTAAYEAVLPHVEKALAGEGCTFQGTVPYGTGSRFVSARYIPETDASTGEVVGFHAFVEDISERKAAEEVLRRSKTELENRVKERTNDLEKVTSERIKILRRLVGAQEDERQRIARDLHDQLGQQMTVLRLKLAAMQKASDVASKLHKDISEVRGLARSLDSEIGFLAWRSRPAVLDDLGLAAALDQYIAQWSAHVNFTSSFDGARFGDQRLDPESETAFYRITQEALNNVYKHAEASSVSVFLERKDSEAILIIEDDGRGFEPDRELDRNGSGMGLTGMRERMAMIGGTLEIESSEGDGTTIYAAVPFIPGTEVER